MPDGDGRFRGVAVSDVPWCLTCKLVSCICSSPHPAGAAPTPASAAGSGETCTPPHDTGPTFRSFAVTLEPAISTFCELIEMQHRGVTVNDTDRVLEIAEQFSSKDSS